MNSLTRAVLMSYGLTLEEILELDVNNYTGRPRFQLEGTIYPQDDDKIIDVECTVIEKALPEGGGNDV